MPRQREFCAVQNAGVFAEVFAMRKELTERRCRCLRRKKDRENRHPCELRGVSPEKQLKKSSKLEALMQDHAPHQILIPLKDIALPQNPHQWAQRSIARQGGSSAQKPPSESASPSASKPSIQQVAQTSSVEFHSYRRATEEVQGYLNDRVSSRCWEVKTPGGDPIREGPNPMEMKPIDCFLWMFPMRHLPKMVSMTGARLRKKGFRGTMAPETPRFFGIILLATRYRVNDRRNLCKKMSKFRYRRHPDFEEF